MNDISKSVINPLGSGKSVDRSEDSNLSDLTYLTTEELAARIKYDSRTIRDRLKDTVLIEGRHYIRPFNGRKILYVWEFIEADMRRYLSNPFAHSMTA